MKARYQYRCYPTSNLSNGEKIDAPKPLQKRINRLRKLSRNLSRKQKGSKRYERARVRQAKLYARIKDTRISIFDGLE